MAPFEILGRGNQNNQTAQFIDVMMRNRSRQDAIAQARAEMRSREREGQLDRLHQEHIQGLQSKNAEALASATAKANAKAQREDAMYKTMKGLTSPNQINAYAQYMKAEGLDDKSVDALTQVALTRSSEVLEDIANKQVSQNAMQQGLAAAMRTQVSSGQPITSDPATAMANFGNVANNQRKNEIDNRAVDATLAGHGVQREQIAAMRHQANQTLRASIANSRGDMQVAFMNNARAIWTDDALSPEEKSFHLMTLGTTTKAFLRESQGALAQVGGDIRVLDKVDPITGAVLRSGMQEDSLGLVIDNAIAEYIKSLEPKEKKEAKEVRGLFKGLWEELTTFTDQQGGYSSPFDRAGGVLQQKLDYIKSLSLGRDKELELFMEYLSQEIGSKPFGQGPRRVAPSIREAPTPRTSRSMVPGIGDLSNYPTSKRNR